MDELVHDAVAGVDRRIAALRAAGANRFDPVGQHYLEALAHRTATHQGRVRCLLDEKLAHSLAAFTARFELAQSEARETIKEAVAAHPHVADELKHFFFASDFNGLKRCIQDLRTDRQPNLLGELVRYVEQHVQETVVVHSGAPAGLRTELKTVRNARNVWSKLSASRQVTGALEQAPKNAGPINSHMLVLRSLALMRDVSPDYLNRFMSYADTLLSLDQGEKEKQANPKKMSSIKAAKNR
ncbi:MAG: hypothetical protein ACI8WM_003364 [Burkholderiaceae bacterium]|jgi:hypothetical protein